jgi:DNA primase
VKVDRENSQFRLIEKALQPDTLSVSEKIPQATYKAADNNGKKLLLKMAYEKALRKVGTKLDSNFRCFIEGHSDSNPSMRWNEKKSFHCFGCMDAGINYDLFDALSEVYNLGEQSYSKAYHKAVQLFVAGALDSTESDFTKEMKIAMRYNCHTAIADDALGLAYLAKRGISKEVATAYGLQTWEFQGARYLVFINSNGSLVRRLIAVNKAIAGMYSSEPLKWFNQKGKSGIFNQHIVEKASKEKQPVFVVEGAIDCLTLIEGIGSAEGGSYAIALNSTQNLPAFLRETDYRYIIGFMDNDSTGQQAAELLKEKGYYIVDYAEYEHLRQYKDINEAFVADRKKTSTEIQQIIAKAKEYYNMEDK